MSDQGAAKRKLSHVATPIDEDALTHTEQADALREELAPLAKRCAVWSMEAQAEPFRHVLTQPVECDVCEDMFVPENGGLVVCPGVLPSDSKRSFGVALEPHEPHRLCATCLAHTFLSGNRYPVCRHCFSIPTPARCVRASPELQTMSAERLSQFRRLYACNRHRMFPRCLLCNQQGKAIGDGTIRFQCTASRPECFSVTGQYPVFSDICTTTDQHVPLCEACNGPRVWCFCERASKQHIKNHFFRDMRDVPLGKAALIEYNDIITRRACVAFVIWLLTYAGPVPAVCPGCRRHIARGDVQCHELGCCGYRICYYCGFAARGPVLIDHYEFDCTQFTQDLLLGGETFLCTKECQTLSHDCCIEDHQPFLQKFHIRRRHNWLHNFIRAASTEHLPAIGAAIRSLCFPEDGGVGRSQTLQPTVPIPKEHRSFHKTMPFPISVTAFEALKLIDNLQM